MPTPRSPLTPFFASVRAAGFHRTRPRLLGGIAAGIAARTGVNVWLVRLVLVLASLLPVIGVGAYLLTWALTPWEDGVIPAERLLVGG